ncbi:MAG: hypothetical protein AB7P99_02600 [Vicinamibacterales bacterium]
MASQSAIGACRAASAHGVASGPERIDVHEDGRRDEGRRQADEHVARQGALPGEIQRQEGQNEQDGVAKVKRVGIAERVAEQRRRLEAGGRPGREREGDFRVGPAAGLLRPGRVAGNDQLLPEPFGMLARELA